MTQVVILVGGRGTRLLTLTKDRIPKPMINIGKNPFLLHLINEFKKHGLTNFVLCTGYLSNAFKEFFGDGSRFDVSITYSEEYKPLGSAGALKNAECLLEENFILVNGDDFYNIDYNNFFSFHEKNKALVTLALRKIREKNEFHTVCLGEDSRIVRYLGRDYNDQSNANFSGYFVINRRILEDIPSDTFVSLEFDVFPLIEKTGRFFGFLTDGALFDIGSPEGYSKFLEWANLNLEI